MHLLPWSREGDGLSLLQRQMNRLFNDVFTSDAPTGSWASSVDMEETDEAVIVRAEVPGIEAKDIDIQIVNNCLIVRGEKREGEASGGKTWQRVERRYGSFSRTLPLPCEVDREKVGAEMDNGVLTVTMAKQESIKPRKISVRVK